MITFTHNLRQSCYVNNKTKNISYWKRIHLCIIDFFENTTMLCSDKEHKENHHYDENIQNKLKVQGHTMFKLKVWILLVIVFILTSTSQTAQSRFCQCFYLYTSHVTNTWYMSCKWHLAWLKPFVVDYYITSLVYSYAYYEINCI